MPRRWVCSLRVCPRVLLCPWMSSWQTSTVAVHSAWARHLVMRLIYQGFRVLMLMAALRVRRCV